MSHRCHRFSQIVGGPDDYDESMATDFGDSPLTPVECDRPKLSLLFVVVLVVEEQTTTGDNK